MNKSDENKVVVMVQGTNFLSKRKD
jgi:hypothetical protein